MTRRQQKLTAQLPPACGGPDPGDHSHRPVSRARAPSRHLASMDRADTPTHFPHPHPHEPVPPSAATGLSRPKMDRPKVRPSNSGHSMNEAQLARELGHSVRHTGQRTAGDTVPMFPHIDNKGTGGQWGPKKQQLPKINEGKPYEATDNKAFQLPSLTGGKLPTPPDTAKPAGIPRVKTFAHSHNMATTQPAHAPPGRRFKSMMHAHPAVVGGLQPVPPPPRIADHVPAPVPPPPRIANHVPASVPPPPRIADHMPAGTKESKMHSPEAKISDHMISATKEKIILSPHDLRMVSPASSESRHDGSHTTINYEVIRSPSSLTDAASSVSGHSYVIKEKRKSQTTLIDVNIQPSNQSLISNKGGGSGAEKRHKKRRGSRC